MKKCKVEGCNCKHHAKGYCKKHYLQMYRHGEIFNRTKNDPNDVIKYEDYAEIVLYDIKNIEIARALIDLEDIDKVKDIKWHLNKNGYVQTNINNKNTEHINLLHRLLMDCPDDKVVDHINHNTLDNRKSNLRICTKYENNKNTRLSKNNTSGTTGVYWNKLKNKWQAGIKVNYKQIHLGYFETKEEAIEARKQAEIDYFGEYRNKEDEEN